MSHSFSSKILSIFFLLITSFMVASCSALFPKASPPAKIFTLNAPSTELDSPVAAQALPSVKIILPNAAPGLETERIALRDGKNRIEYYRDIYWADTSTALIQSLLVESFDNSKAFKSVSSDLTDIESDYRLMVEIRDFQIEFADNQPYAHLRFIARLVRNDPQQVVMTRSYNARKQADKNDLESIMHAFDQAYQDIAADIVRDSIATLRRHQK